MASEILYAQTLYQTHLRHAEVSDIGWQLTAPANNDPMLARISRVRNQEYLFCDAIDEQYGDLAVRVAPTYALWRRATAEQALWLEQYEERVSERGDNAGDGRFARMQAHYAAYRSYRIQEQALWELAEAFEGESQPTMLKTASRVVRLEGTLESQYDEWRQICATSSFLSRAVGMVTHRFTATCPAGVGVYLAQELTEFGAVRWLSAQLGFSSLATGRLTHLPVEPIGESGDLGARLLSCPNR